MPKLSMPGPELKPSIPTLVGQDRKCSWSGGGKVTLPHGTELRMKYKESLHRGKIKMGEWWIDDQSFSSPSAATNHVAKVSLNDWLYWDVKRPGDDCWTLINQLRESLLFP